MALNPKIESWRGLRVWLIGASSGIGAATASSLHRRGASVIVSARREAELKAFAARHPGTQVLPLDVQAPDSIRAAAATIDTEGGPADLVFYCAGYYRALRATGFDLGEMLLHRAINYDGALYVLDAVLPGLLARGRGHLSLMGSVAAYRGLPRALAYGPTKAALNNLAECLYLDLSERGLGVSIVNPGFVDTSLTAQNGFPMPQLMTAEDAGERIVQGWEQGDFEIRFPRMFTLGLKTLRTASHALYFAAVRRATGL